ncbi:inositol phosphorylceramide synthase [Paenibacillus sp. GCM10027629]|uniref:inositol phosphorylceramide synthase n=1 Tax=Paenibacillus sp. GCM10027629 TaxID=3273414 RepID=UPI0036400780
MKRNTRLQSLLPLLWLLVIPVLNIFYMVLNHGGEQVYNLMTDLDNAIPFLPVFIIPYVLWYPFLIGVFVLLCLKNRSIYYQTLLAVILGLIGSYLIYYVFQTTVPRPELHNNGILIQMVKGIYTLDGPYNCFPSIHVLTSYLLWIGARSCHAIPSSVKMIIGAISWSIITSTFFVKQHALLDAVGAIILAEIVFRFAALLLRQLFGYRPAVTVRHVREQQKPMP